MLVFFRKWLIRRRPHPFVEPADLRRSLGRYGLHIAAMVSLHTAAMVTFEGLAAGDALWLTLTTITTVGYGDFSAATPAGRVATVGLIYIGGVFVLFQGAAVWFEYRSDRRDRMLTGRWRWNLSGHILLLGVPADEPAGYLRRLAEEFRHSRRFKALPVQIVTRAFPGGLPEELLDLGLVHTQGNIHDPATLACAGARDAAVIVVLAGNDADAASDGLTFDVLDRLTELGTRARVLAECVDDCNRNRLRRAGAAIVVRPLRGYPEMIVRALAAPGAETIMEDLFTSRGDECWRYDVRVRDAVWTAIVRLLVEHNIGIPIAFRAAADRGLHVNPLPATRVDADKLYVLVREGNARPDAEVQALIDRGC